MTKRLYVGNLAPHTTARDLTSVFERVGHVVSTRIITDRDTGRSKGFGFVEMDGEDAERAITQLIHTELDGQTLSVTEARVRLQASADRSVPPSRLFVGNLPYDATAQELKALFSTVGVVSFLSLPIERESGKPRGFAFVEFSDSAHAHEAIRRFHQQLFKGRALAVTEARARENRPVPHDPSQSTPAQREYAAPLDERSSHQDGHGRHFGPDAVPRRSRKQTGRAPKVERTHGKPLRERKGGQFFSTEDDERYDETFTENTFADQTSDPESIEQP